MMYLDIFSIRKTTWLQMKRDGYEADKMTSLLISRAIEPTANWDGTVDEHLE
jgi:hypothetical protein